MNCSHVCSLLQCFSAIIMRICDPKMTTLIFASGKMVVTGVKAEDDSSLPSRKYARVNRNLGFDDQFLEFCDARYDLRLLSIRRDLRSTI